MKNLCVIGVGYVGLVTGACLADLGNRVTCLNRNKQKSENLKRGILPIYEPGLEDLLVRNRASGRITFTTELQPAISAADLVFLAVGTPMRRGDGFADLSYIYKAVAEIAPHLSGSTVIATKSTVPVGTSREIERRIR